MRELKGRGEMGSFPPTRICISWEIPHGHSGISVNNSSVPARIAAEERSLLVGPEKEFLPT